MGKGPEIRQKVHEAKTRYVRGEITYDELFEIAKGICREMEAIQKEKFGKIRQRFTPGYILR